MWQNELFVWNETEPIKCIPFVIVPFDQDKVPIWVPSVAVVNE